MRHAFFRNNAKTHGGTELTGIKTTRYQNQANADGVLKFGNAFASSVEATYYIDSQTDLAVGEPLWYYRVKNNVYTFITIVWVDSFSKNGILARFTAYDVIHKLDVDYSPRLLAIKANFPMTVKNLLDDISSYTGITFNNSWATGIRDALVNYFYVDGITARTLVGQIYELLGYDLAAHNYSVGLNQVFISGDTYSANNNYIISPTDQATYVLNGVTLTPIYYKQGGLTVGDDVYDPIDCVKAIKSDGTIVGSYTYSGTENNIYYIKNNILVENINSFANQTALSGVFNSINNVNTSPKVKALLFPFNCPFRIHDITHFVDKDGNIKSFPIMNIVWENDKVTVESYGASVQNYEDYDTGNLGSQADVTASVLNKLADSITDLSVIVGNGSLDPGFLASDLTGAVNELYTDVQNVETTLDAKTGAILLPTGTTADRRAEIVDKLNTYGYCEFVAGDYYISAAIDLSDGHTIKGCGKESVLRKTTSGTTDAFFNIINNAKNVTIKDLALYGANTVKPSTQNTGNGEMGVYIEEQSERTTIENCLFSGFTRAGIFCANGYSLLTSINVTNCNFIYCNYGIRFDEFGEFANITNCNFINNYYGTIVIGGNNKFANCGFDSNVVGFVLYDSSGVPTNDGHGSAVGCTFNHNSSRSIEITNIDNGYLFSGCNIFFGDILVSNSKGIQFDNCIVMGTKTDGNGNIIGTANFSISNCPGLVAITNCCCLNTLTISKTNSDYVFSKNNKNRNGLVAAANDRYVQMGEVTGNSTPAGGYTDKTVTFSPAFPSVPHVQVTPKTDLSGTSLETGKVNFMVGYATTTGFTIRTYNNGSIARTGVYNWLAFIAE